MPAFLKRKNFEDWSQELHDKLKAAIVGAFVKVSHRGKYRVVEIVDIKMNLEAGESGVYQLGKDKTSIIAHLRYGDSEHWSKLSLLSNQDPNEDEVKRMLLSFKVTN